MQKGLRGAPSFYFGRYLDSSCYQGTKLVLSQVHVAGTEYVPWVA